MPKTENLGLTLTDDNTTVVRDWRTAINGVGSGANLSNMQIIDKAIGDINKFLASIGINTSLAEFLERGIT